jgi:DNA mismatch repair protein MutS
MQNESDSLNTPAMKQFTEIKKNYPEGILFFRMGDFYEMFLDDAIRASKILDITLTRRQNSIPMCGIPFHATESYISRLIHAGEKVVICEQKKSEDPTVKLMQREVVRVITPGTLVEENLLGSFENNFFSVFHFENQKIKIAFADVSTSDLFFFEISIDEKEKLFSYLKKFSPKEIILIQEEDFYWKQINFDESLIQTIISQTDIPKLKSKQKFDYLKQIIEFILFKNFKRTDFYFKDPIILEDLEYLQIDEQSVKNLDLIENQNFNSKHNSLFTVLNFCKTSVGKRTLKNRILFPFCNHVSIEKIWSEIDILSKDKELKNIISTKLSEFSDIERILSRFRTGKALPRDFKAIQKNIENSFELEKLLNLKGFEFILPEESLSKVNSYILERVSENEVPAVLGGEGEFIKSGFSKVLDKAREAKTNGKDWILDLEDKERKRLGLNTYKIRYNKIVGFYVEVSRKESELIPKNYQKKQTLVTSERFTFPDLEEIERTILEADEKISEIEKEEFDNLVVSVLKETSAFNLLAKLIGNLDYSYSLAIAQKEYSWIKPEINNESKLELTESRHPVIEKFLKFGERFIANDVYLDTNHSSIAILTGPNMAGKSTYMRQIAICQILFQMGSYIPARNANLSIVDKVFTRIGSGDDITTGQSTFYVEMKETAFILNECTENSLILFDEIGRGTSTYDGMSLAWSIIEYLSQKKVKTKTIFATHYHELTSLDKLSGVFNLYLDTMEENEDILFLKKVKKGVAKKSFGIYVAKIAGIPNEIIDRAKILLQNLESKKKEIKTQSDSQLLLPLSISNLESDILKEIKELNIDSITPIQALQKLELWKKKVSKNG